MNTHPYKRVIIISILCITHCLESWALSGSSELTLEETIRLTIAKHPKTKADRLREQAIQKNINIARARYYPRMNAMALVTSGFSGSSGATGVGGLMVSPYHQGPSAGFLFEQEIWDFGRTSGAISVAEKESALAESESKVSSLTIAQNAIQSFYTCSKDKSLAADYEMIQKETQNVAKEVESFVKKGQRSVVDRLLAKGQAEEAVTLTETFRKRLELDSQELSLLTGLKKEQMECPLLATDVIQHTLAFFDSQSPYVDQAGKRIEVSKARMMLAKKDYLPRIVGLGSIGYMEGTELGVPMKNYSVAAGLIFPLFEGFKTNAEVARESIRTAQFEQEQAAIQQDIQQANYRYDRSIESARVQMDHLKDELILAKKAFLLAKTRYQNTQGPLIDLREAVRNLARTHTQLRDAQATYLSQQAEKALVNGGMILRNVRQ